MKEQGLFMPDGSFRSRKDITMSNTPKLESVQFVTPLGSWDKPFSEWADIFIRRQEERLEFSPPKHIEIKIDTDKAILLGLFGDLHVGGEKVAYERLKNDVEYMAGTQGTFVLAAGDVTDSFFWGRDAQDGELASFKEQNAFAFSALKLFADNKKLLAGWRGDHDGWALQSGEDIYSRFVRELGAHYLDGVSYVSLHVGDQLYKISGAHRHGGFSIYNKAHAALRLYNDSARGSDIAFTAHTHQKGYITQSVKDFGGQENTVHFISVGPYKQGDRYLDKMGYNEITDAGIGAQTILLRPDKKQIQVFATVEEGLEALSLHRR